MSTGRWYAVTDIPRGAFLFMDYGLNVNDMDRVNEMNAVNAVNPRARGNVNRRYFPVYIHPDDNEIRYLRTVQVETPFQHLLQPMREERPYPRNVSWDCWDADEPTAKVDMFVYFHARVDIEQGQMLIGPQPIDQCRLPLGSASGRPYAAAYKPPNLVGPVHPVKPNVDWLSNDNDPEEEDEEGEDD